MARLTLDRVTFHYPATTRPALREISLEVAAGEVVALIGNVGAGASTLLLVAADLAPRIVGGTLTGTVAGDATRAIVLATPWTQVSGMAFTVWDEVAFGPANLGWPIDRIRSAVDRELGRLGISTLAQREPATLSGGELQRVIVAGALAMEPELLLLDEPTAELDPEGADVLWRLLQTLAHKEGTSVIVATSDIDAVPLFADRVVRLSDGAIERAGPPVDFWTGAEEDAPLVASVWHAAGCRRSGSVPLTVADAVRQLR